jgi:hypothetical protein
MRRWRVPFGAFTIIYTGFGLLVNIMTEYRDIVLIIPLIVFGITLDVMQKQLAGARTDGRLTLGGIRLIGPISAFILWGVYYLVLALDKGIGWPPTLWVGALMVAVLTGFGCAFLVAPPSYGPRLVEQDDADVVPSTSS